MDDEVVVDKADPSLVELERLDCTEVSPAVGGDARFGFEPWYDETVLEKVEDGIATFLEPIGGWVGGLVGVAPYGWGFLVNRTSSP